MVDGVRYVGDEQGLRGTGQDWQVGRGGVDWAWPAAWGGRLGGVGVATRCVGDKRGLSGGAQGTGGWGGTVGGGGARAN